MRKLIFICVLITSSISCNSDDEDSMYSQCLQDRIEAVLEDPVQSPKANIQKYIYENEEVFLVNFQNFPDGQSSVMTVDCQTICVIGGIDGPNNDCQNWIAAIFIETVWEDPR